VALWLDFGFVLIEWSFLVVVCDCILIYVTDKVALLLLIFAYV
jgi:hypothetical protein